MSLKTDPAEPIDFAFSRAPDLHARLAEFRDQASIVPTLYQRKPAWLVTRHAELRAAFKAEDLFQSGTIQEPLVGKTMQSMTGDQHRINRGLISFAFIPSAVGGMIESLLEPLAFELLDELSTDSEFDLVAGFAQRFPAAVITRMLGIPVADEKQFLSWALMLFQYPWDPDGATKAWKAFKAYLAPILKNRRAHPGDDLLSVLIEADLEGRRLTDTEILSFIGILYPAGSDTAFKSIGSMMYAVLTHPEVRAQAIADPESRAAVAEEAMRWEPPVAVLPRRAVRDGEFAGTNIRAGEDVLFAIASANRDPAVFQQPDRFDPSRANLKQSLVFGHGVHVCLGAQLARHEMRVALGALLERFPQMEIVDSDAVEISGAILRGPRELTVRIA